MTLITTTYNSKTHKIVPIEPTEEMLERGYEALMDWDARTGEDMSIWQIYRGMLTAAPAAPSGLLAPWADYRGYPIHEGDTIRHPFDGAEGRVIFVNEQWRVDYGDGVMSALSLQICEKGQAVVVPTLPTLPTPPAP